MTLFHQTIKKEDAAQSSNSFDLLVSIVLYKPNLIYLTQTINSLSETNLRIKIILYDNSPDENTFDFSSNHHIVYYHDKRNIGFGAAHNRNMLSHLHEAPYFLILNPDIFFDPLLLPTLIDRMNSDRSISLSIPKICHPSGEIQNVNRRLPSIFDYLINFINSKLGTRIINTSKYKKFLLEDIDKNLPFVCPMISGCFMLFASKYLKTLNGFDERFFLYLEDADLSRRAARISNTVVFSDLSAYHHWGRGAYRNFKLFMTFIKNMVRYFNKWGWIFDQERHLLNSKVVLYKYSPQRPVDKSPHL